MRPYAAILPFLGLLAVPPLAQDGRPSRTPDARSTQDAAPSFLPAGAGARTALEAPDGTPLGTIRDHVLDTQTGRITQIAVQTVRQSEGAVLVPYERFSFGPRGRRLTLDLTPDELSAQPAFRPAELHARASEADATPGSASRASEPRRGPRWVLSSSLAGTALAAADGTLGSVDELLIDRERGQVAFLLVATDSPGAPVLVPWSALTWTRAAGDAEPRFEPTLPHDLEALSAAPRLAEGDAAALDAPERVAAVREFYASLSAPRN